jgi:hypothetical protein
MIDKELLNQVVGRKLRNKETGEEVEIKRMEMRPTPLGDKPLFILYPLGVEDPEEKRYHVNLETLKTYFDPV